MAPTARGTPVPAGLLLPDQDGANLAKSPLAGDRAGRDVALAWSRRVCSERLRAADFAEIVGRLEAIGWSAERCARTIAVVGEAPSSHEPVITLRAAPELAARPDAVPRVMLLQAALRSIDALGTAAALPAAVVKGFCDEFVFFAAPGEDDARYFEPATARFTGCCKLATLRRFPAGQFHWEVSGVARRDLARVRGISLVRALACVAFEMRGLQPVYYSHLNPRRAQKSLSEAEGNRSYYLMARAMEGDPRIRGFAACSWFRSPATQAVSPHLAGLSRVFLENGGLVVDAGPAPEDCGVFHRSATRRTLYEQGRFRPTLGLVLWPRRAMLAWARAHPEYAP